MTPKFNLKADAFDARDYQMRLTYAPVPHRVDLRAYCSPVEDQGQIGSCTGNAIANALEFLENHAKAQPFVDLSRLFIYWNERDLEGDPGVDSGASLRDGIKVVAKLGVCSERTWPYLENQVLTKPTPAAYTEALQRRSVTYVRVPRTAVGITQALAAGFPFVIGFEVFESFMTQQVADTGIVPYPHQGEQALGGHAVLAVGYDLTARTVLCKNSYGSGWGQQGYFTIPMAYLTNPYLASDFWQIRR